MQSGEGLVWEQSLGSGAAQASCQTQFSTHYSVMRNCIWTQLCTHPSNNTLRIQKILSLHKSTHLIGAIPFTLELEKGRGRLRM